MAGAHDKVRKRLEQELTETVTQLRELGAPQSVGTDGDGGGASTVLDEADQIQVSQARDLAFATRQRLTQRLHRIQAAIERLDGPQYGRCLECGRRIEAARLRAMPEAERCLRCQEGFERTAA
jgi:DnaK suppressor protein